ncbi:MAG: hypothetical protein ACRDNZ_21035, partial [Streptosporangiaceae bacterium]
EAAQVCHNVLAHSGALAVALDQLQVLVAAATTADGFHLGIHIVTTLEAGWGGGQRARRENDIFHRASLPQHQETPGTSISG